MQQIPKAFVKVYLPTPARSLPLIPFPTLFLGTPFVIVIKKVCTTPPAKELQRA